VIRSLGFGSIFDLRQGCLSDGKSFFLCLKTLRDLILLWLLEAVEQILRCEELRSARSRKKRNARMKFDENFSSLGISSAVYGFLRLESFRILRFSSSPRAPQLLS
jgi:hypothetical protein